MGPSSRFTVDVWNPESSALTRYTPGCRLGNVYAPESFVSVVVDTPVLVFIAVIVKPGITAPLASDTLPPNWAFWEIAVLTMIKPRRIAAPTYLPIFSLLLLAERTAKKRLRPVLFSQITFASKLV